MINSVGHVESIGDETFTNTEHKVHHKKLTHQRMIDHTEEMCELR